MADIRMGRQRPDRSKINVSDDENVRHWCKHLGVSKDELADAIDKVGNSAAAVRKELDVNARIAAAACPAVAK